MLLNTTLQTSTECQAVQAPVDLLIKFLERLYRTLPQFCTVAHTQEFIEALAASLFPPHVSSGEEGESDMIEFDDEEVGCVCVCVLLSTAGYN